MDEFRTLTTGGPADVAVYFPASEAAPPSMTWPLSTVTPLPGVDASPVRMPSTLAALAARA